MAFTLKLSKSIFARIFSRVLLALLVLFTSACAWSLEKQADDAQFQCGGKLETEIWQLWDSSAKEYLKTEQLTKRLKAKGDTYALYDVQTFTHNLVAMAQRCKRGVRLEEMAELFAETFANLEPAPDNQHGTAWICKGGAICNDKNRLINKEVMLTSLQFLALVNSVANSVSRSPKLEQLSFVEQVTNVSIQHLLRWGDAAALRQLDTQIAAKATDVKNGSSALFFTDKPLWMIAVYADLAGALHNNSNLRAQVKLTETQMQTMQLHLSKLLKAFEARTTLMKGMNRSGQPVELADLDRGFRGLYADNKYASYTGSEKPVTCLKQADGSFKKAVAINPDTVAPAENLGWDISHARRFVHVFDAIERNRAALEKVFGVAPVNLPSEKVMRAFANQLEVNIWNGDVNYPLFTNYWSGANGWFRVAYDIGIDRCMEGYAPFGLTDSFPTGGFASWGRFNSTVRLLGKKIYLSSLSEDTESIRFIEQSYKGLSAKSPTTKLMTQLMFWPSLIEAEK